MEMKTYLAEFCVPWTDATLTSFLSDLQQAAKGQWQTIIHEMSLYSYQKSILDTSFFTIYQKLNVISSKISYVV